MAARSRTSSRIIAALLAVLLVLLAAAAALSAGSTAANAQEGYRYWNYAHIGPDGWTLAGTGPADYLPKDGAVEGWRFGTSTAARGIYPRADLHAVNFDTVCGGEKAATGEKRVAVLIDFGTEADAPKDVAVPDPRAECVVVPGDADGLEVLQEVVQVRSEGGLMCGLDGYPATGCGDPVAKAAPPATEPTVAFALPGGSPSPSAGDTGDTGTASESQQSDGGLGWPVVVGVLVVLAAAALAVPLLRRRRG
ncbi:SCO2322 family protein [Nocardioides mesophilus]|uniref:Uncharacterized protein n=1 Tax=Nocardioides mesophilus TaxID=433659 RepID=A0A7G9RC80_9ACTN|nr:SCO2322 family protein [Nocardioides mesophilus]QNN53205.1 hypothetical protein H9L09_01555 [Nocardioides mesophilus]